MTETSKNWKEGVVETLGQRLKGFEEGTPERIALSKLERHLDLGLFRRKPNAPIGEQLLSHFGPRSEHHDPDIHRILTKFRFALMTDAELGVDPGSVALKVLTQRRGGIRPRPRPSWKRKR